MFNPTRERYRRNMPAVHRALIFVSLPALLAVVFSFFTLHAGDPGTLDFIQYWSAWQLMRQGSNPYDAEQLAQIQFALRQFSDQLIFSWNPPWTFVALSPLLSLPFEQSAAVWLGIQIGLLCIISTTLPRGLGRRQPPLLIVAATTALFFPILDSIHWGQLSILFALGITLFLYFQRVGAPFLAGISLLPLSFKPHLFFLFIIPGLLWLRQLSRRDRIRVLAGMIGSFTILVSICIALRPSVCTDWITALSTKDLQSPAVQISDWKTATLVTWIRILIAEWAQGLVNWPMWLVPLLGIAACIFLCWRRRNKIEWETLTPPLLCLSLGTCNYGWVYDQSVLVVCQMALVCDLYRHNIRSEVFTRTAILVIIQVICISGSIACDLPQHYYAWLPWVYLVLLWNNPCASAMAIHRKGA
jgi:hypothetical protein